MSTISFLNQPLSAAVVNNTTANVTDLFFVIWKLTRAMKKAGWTYKSSGDGTSLGKDTTGVAANDKWGGNADPATDTYTGFNAVSAWWNAQGPSTLKIPISTASAGTFIRGEDVSQATTGAHGELLGYLWDIPTNQGYLVVAPRIDGSGADPHGWDHTYVITGAISGATITPSATVIEFVREVVFWKSNVAGASGGQGIGNMYYQCVDGYSESAFRFSSLAANAAGCSGNIAPGAGGTANTFPTVGSFVVNGCAGNTTSVGTQSLPAAGNTFGVVSTVGFPTTGGSLSIAGNTVTYTGITGNTFTGCSGGSGTITAGTVVSVVNAFPNRWTNHTPVGQNQCHIVALNNAYTTNVSADGSFWIAVGAPATANPWTTDNGVYDGWMFSIVDNAEPGDVDPYVWYLPSSDNAYTTNPLSIPGAAASTQPWSIHTQNSGLQFRMLRKRGMGGTGDGFTHAGHAVVTIGQGGAGSLSPILTQNTADRETLACTFNTTYLAEDVWAISNQPYLRLRKGILRWLKAVTPGGNASGTDTFGAKSWVQLNTTTAPYIAGPWDGTTTPVNGHV